MPIIHMDTENVNNLIDRCSRTVETLYESYTSCNKTRSKLALAWISPQTSYFQKRYQGLLHNIEVQINELAKLTINLLREREEWEVVDGAFKSRVARSADNYKFKEKEGSLFVKGKNDESDISYDDIDQGLIADCYLLAALSAIAETDPEFIRNMIKDNGDGTYTVYFYENGKRIPITVDNTFPKKKDLCADTTGAASQDKNELWPLIIEKAYAEYKGGYDAIEWGYPSEAFNDLLGKEATELFWLGTPSPQEQQLRLQEIQTALSNNNPVVVGMNGHAYSLRGIEGDRVLLYNPYGENESIPLEEFYGNCSNISYVTN